MAVVKVVLPWSTCPIVPTFTCGLVRSNFGLDISVSFFSSSAGDGDRTHDLLLTKEVLYQLSYPSKTVYKSGAGDGNRTHVCSLEGCRSTIELHPRIRRGSPANGSN